VSIESIEVHTNTVDEHIEVHSGSHTTFELHAVVEPTTSVSESVPTEEEHMVTVLQQQVVNPRKNIQHGLDLWERVREYDERSAKEDFMSVLTRKQKQKLKVQQVLATQPSKIGARGEHLSTDQ